MKTIIYKFALLTIILMGFISTGMAQKTCSLRIFDPATNGPYHATVELFYNNGGTYVQIGNPAYYYNLSSTTTNDLSLPWSPPFTWDNVYILRVTTYDVYSNVATSSPDYSAWFNTPTYNNYKINVEANF
jgi:hypothetical protein